MTTYTIQKAQDTKSLYIVVDSKGNNISCKVPYKVAEKLVAKWSSVEEQPSGDPVHDLGKGYTAKRNGKGFDVFYNDKFKFYAIRLKAAKQQVKSM